MDDHCVGAPGAFNGLCAMGVRDAGFEAAYVSGGATSVAAGVPDVGLLTLDHFTRVVREVVDGTRPTGGTGPALPVIADADTGFGEAEMARRTVIEYHRAGAAGLHIEDQVFPKRCGHLGGKTLIPFDHAVEKIQLAAQASRDCSNGDFIICARTDARSVEGLDASVKRAQAYVEAGATMIFPEGLESEEEFRVFAERMRPVNGVTGKREGPYLLANMTEFGKTPILPQQVFDRLGYHVVIYPVSMLRVAMGAVNRALASLKETGSVHRSLDEMLTRDELYAHVGYRPGVPWDFPAG